MTIKLDVEDSKVDLVLHLLSSLKEDIITKYEVVHNDKEIKSLISLSNKSLEKIWDNSEDSEYDKYLKV